MIWSDSIVATISIQSYCIISLIKNIIIIKNMKWITNSYDQYEQPSYVVCSTIIFIIFISVTIVHSSTVDSDITYSEQS